MIKALRNLLVGFIVSFIGSLPLGYLNVIGFSIYENSGLQSLLPYLLGVIAIEAIVIYLTLIFAHRLADNKKLLKFIGFFSILFMLLLAYIFWSQSAENGGDDDPISKFSNYSPFIIGIICSALNFIQVPFWVGWNLYLLSNHWIIPGKRLEAVYVAGTLAGTFGGMLCFILVLNAVANGSQGFSSILMSHIIPLVFIGLAVYQANVFYRKYYRKGQM